MINVIQTEEAPAYTGEKSNIVHFKDSADDLLDYAATILKKREARIGETT